MVRILDDGHLESLKCSKCHKYLSVFPVKNHVTRDVTCGRCSRYDDDGVRSTLYELIAEKYLFKCVNRYEGCRELLRADETEAHESECMGNVFCCPKCEDGTQRSVLELMWHYRLRHPSSHSKKNSFMVKSPKEDVVLYIQDDVVFFIYIRYVAGSGKLYLNAVTLTDVEATQAFSVGVGPRFEKTERRPCKTVCANDCEDFVVGWDAVEPLQVFVDLEVSDDGKRHHVVPVSGDGKPKKVLSVESIDSVKSKEDSMASISSRKFKVQLPEYFKQKFGYELNDRGTALSHKDGHEIDLTCKNCKELIGLPLFWCSKLNHQVCASCRTWCGICNYKPEQCDSDIEICSRLKFPCKWNCGEYFTSGLRKHENSCKLKMIKCPQCLLEVGLMFMKHHLLKEHKEPLINLYKNYDVKEIKIFERWGGEIYFVLNDKCCSLNCNRETVAFQSLVDGPNTKLQLVCKTSKGLEIRNCEEEISWENLHLYTPYIDFNHNVIL